MSDTRYTVSGRIPDDLGPAADAARKAAAAQPCPKNPMAEKPKWITDYTVAEIVDYLRTVENSEFAASLVAYYGRAGRLTEKQEAAARKMFRQHHRHLTTVWEGSGCHRWEWMGRQYWGDSHSAAYERADFWCCEHCGSWTQRYEHSHHSGDF